MAMDEESESLIQSCRGRHAAAEIMDFTSKGYTSILTSSVMSHSNRSDLQTYRETWSNFLPSLSLAITSKMSSKIIDIYLDKV